MSINFLGSFMLFYIWDFGWDLGLWSVFGAM